MSSAFCRETSEEMDCDLNTFWWTETCPHVAEWADVLLFYRARWDIELAQIWKGLRIPDFVFGTGHFLFSLFH